MSAAMSVVLETRPRTPRRGRGPRPTSTLSWSAELRPGVRVRPVDEPLYTTAAHTLGSAASGDAGPPVQLLADDLGHAVRLHGDAVEHVGHLHRPALVRDDDELRAAAHAVDERRRSGAGSCRRAPPRPRRGCRTGTAACGTAAKSSASAVSDFSPPDMSDIFASFLPRGWAMTSTPVSSGSSGSVSCSSACPPGNSTPKMSWKCWSTCSNVSRKRSRILRSMARDDLRERGAAARRGPRSAARGTSRRSFRVSNSSTAIALTGPMFAICLRRRCARSSSGVAVVDGVGLERALQRRRRAPRRSARGRAFTCTSS